jgi:hypothetical protein
MSNDSLILIKERRTHIGRERARLATQLQSLDNEDKELEIAEKTILRLAAMQGASKPASGGNGIYPKTQKEFVLHALKLHRGGWYENVKDLREAVAALGKDIPMTSFQPLISDMVNTDKTLLRDGSKVGLANATAKGP